MVPQANGESSKVKVKVRVNIHGVFNVSSASMVEKKQDEGQQEEEPMEVENGPVESPGGETAAPQTEEASVKENGTEPATDSAEQGQTQEVSHWPG